MMRKLLAIGAITLGIGLLVIQAVPYGRDHTNPLTRIEPAWDTATTRTLVTRACYDCHSNETVWPWYSHVAPISWLVQRDVDDGRRKLNFSEWNRRQKEGGESAKTVRKGEMPPWFYTLVQREARLSSSEQDGLVRGLELTMGTNRGRDSRAKTDDD
jgi:heme-binding protein